MNTKNDSGFLAGKMLIAAPGMGDPRFARTLLYLCGHDQFHAMGIVVNQPMHALRFRALLRQLGIKTGPDPVPDYPILTGGPVEPERGFVLHSMDFSLPDETLKTCSTIGMTASAEVLLAMASDTPPQHCILALGLSSWGPGQLEEELQANAWLICDADTDLIFGQKFDNKWGQAMQKLGVDPNRFSDVSGHA